MTLLLAAIVLLAMPTAAPAARWGTATMLASNSSDNADLAGDRSADGSHAAAIWHRSIGSHYVIHVRIATVSGLTQSWSATQTLSAPGFDARSPKVKLSADGSRATAAWARTTDEGVVIESASATIEGNVATWGPTTTVSAPTSSAYHPDLSISADGSRAGAIWVVDATDNALVSSFATIDGNRAQWGAPVDIVPQGGDTSGILTTKLLMSEDGTHATAAWTAEDVTPDWSYLWLLSTATASVDGTTPDWGPTVRHTESSGDDIDFDGLAISPSGRQAVLVYSRVSGACGYIGGCVLSLLVRSGSIDGTSQSWGPPQRLFRGDVSEFNSARASISADGKLALVAWAQQGRKLALPVELDGTTMRPGTRQAVTQHPFYDYDLDKVNVQLSADGTRAIMVWDGDGGVSAASASIDGTTVVWGRSSRIQPETALWDFPVGMPADGSSATVTWLARSSLMSYFHVQSAIYQYSRPPSNIFTIERAVVRPRARRVALRTRAALPGEGSLMLRASVRSRGHWIRVCSKTIAVKRSGSHPVACTSDEEVRDSLRRSPATFRLLVTFTPRGGHAADHAVSVTRTARP